ncbi:helix-turn-helix domain-containing protein [Streptomyces sp. NPDC093982]|uniref:helix-turn-helix transcriptional regulator n=1 Tax=Streptomyces sp. NPDC093982 TaxID=3155077 RepID=UPI00342D5CB9
MAQGVDPVEAVAARVSELRKRKDMTAAEVGRRMTDLGLKWDRFTVANLESGKRQSVTLTEWLALARVLDVSPLHLLVPLEEVDFNVTPDEAVPASRARAWLRGSESLPGTDQRIFRSEVPLDELPVTSSPGRLTAEGQAVRMGMRAEYRAATGKELDEDALLNWMFRGERPPEMGDRTGA